MIVLFKLIDMTREQKASNITTTKVYAHTHFIMGNHHECNYLNEPQALLGVMDESIKYRSNLEEFKKHWLKQQKKR